MPVNLSTQTVKILFFIIWLSMKSSKFIPELIAPCGMNCGICVAFFGYTLNGEKRKHACNTCRLRESKCAFIKKQCNKLATKEIKYCFECPGFPCANLRTLDKRYREKYGMSMIDNLKYIQASGIDKFLEKEQEKWRCPNCDGTICVHDKKCYTCNIIPAIKPEKIVPEI